MKRSGKVPSEEVTEHNWYQNREGEEGMLASGEGSWDRTCRGWPGPCAGQRGIETTGRGAGNVWIQDSLFPVAFCDTALAARVTPGEAAPQLGRARAGVVPAAWLPGLLPPHTGLLISAHDRGGKWSSLKELWGPCSEPGQSPREITAVRHGKGERASRPACNYGPRSADCRSPIN